MGAVMTRASFLEVGRIAIFSEPSKVKWYSPLASGSGRLTLSALVSSWMVVLNIKSLFYIEDSMRDLST